MLWFLVQSFFQFSQPITQFAKILFYQRAIFFQRQANLVPTFLELNFARMLLIKANLIIKNPDRI